MALAQRMLSSGRGVNGSAFLVEGMQSSSDPIFISDRAYRSAMNVVNRGGIVRTRPGFREISELPSGIVQGVCTFRPTGATPTIVFAVAGNVFACDYPFTDYRQVDGLSFYEFAPEVHFATATKSVQREDDGSLTPVEPRRVLVIQDGGFSKAGFWDGHEARHCDPSNAADATAVVADGEVTSIVVTDPGTGYTATPTVTIVSQDGGSGATATATMLGGKILSIQITSGGSNYLAVPTVVIEGTASKNETPLGGHMFFSGGRLWVAIREKLVASDLEDPLSFTENTYLGEGGYLTVVDPVTALTEMPSASGSTAQLLAFTEHNVTAFQSGVRDRTAWKTTPNFQDVILPGIGCISGRSLVRHFGMLWWMTSTGLTNFDAARQARITSQLAPQDTEMAVSKGGLNLSLAKTASGSFENYLLVSVPNASRYNTHTWVRDEAVVSEAGKSGSPAWNSYWTGPQPIQWASGMFNKSNRTVFVSTDQDGINRLWESFAPGREDNNSPIRCFLETKTHVDFSEKATGLDLKRFVFAEVHFTELVGTVNASIYYCGTRGSYKKLGDYTFKAAEGSFSTSADEITEDTDVLTYRSQARLVRTPEVKQNSTGSCSVRGIESPLDDWVDIGFSLLIVWTGQAAVRSYRIFVDPFQEPESGNTAVPETTDRVSTTVICPN